MTLILSKQHSHRASFGFTGPLFGSAELLGVGEQCMNRILIQLLGDLKGGLQHFSPEMDLFHLNKTQLKMQEAGLHNVDQLFKVQFMEA